MLGIGSVSAADDLVAAQVRPQRLRNRDRPILALIVLEHRDQRAADREPRPVERVQWLWLARLRVAPTRLHAPRLKRLAVAARRDLSILVLARQPDLDVVGLSRGETDVA